MSTEPKTPKAPVDTCVDKTGHNYQAAVLTTVTEHPKPELSLTHNAWQIFCTRCGKTSKLNEVEFRNV